jgi:hypothetical protein
MTKIRHSDMNTDMYKDTHICVCCTEMHASVLVRVRVRVRMRVACACVLGVSESLGPSGSKTRCPTCRRTTRAFHVEPLVPNRVWRM